MKRLCSVILFTVALGGCADQDAKERAEAAKARYHADLAACTQQYPKVPATIRMWAMCADAPTLAYATNTNLPASIAENINNERHQLADKYASGSISSDQYRLQYKTILEEADALSREYRQSRADDFAKIMLSKQRTTTCSGGAYSATCRTY